MSSNPFDVCGAKSFGLNVAWIERVTAEVMAKACIDNSVVPPLTMFKRAPNADGRARLPA